MYTSTTPQKDIEIVEEILKEDSDEEKIKRLKKESDSYCSDCLTKKDKFYFAGAMSTCECGAEDFKENGEEKYPHLYERWQKTVDSLNEIREGLEEIEEDAEDIDEGEVTKIDGVPIIKSKRFKDEENPDKGGE